MNAVGQIQLGDRRVSLAAVRAHPDQYSHVLLSAKTEVGHGLCLCRESDPLRLVIRCSAGGLFHLACWPLSGPAHDPRCRFFRLDDEFSGRSNYSLEAIREDDHGNVSVRLNLPLTRSATTDSGSTAADGQGVGRRTVGLLGLLHHLFDSAHLNVWHPDMPRRNWQMVTDALTEQIATTTISGQPGLDSIYVIPTYRDGLGPEQGAAFDRFLKALIGHGPDPRYGLLLGQLNDIHPTKSGFFYQLAQLGRQRMVFVSAELHDKLTRRYRTAFTTALAKRGCRVVLAHLTYVKRRGYSLALANDIAVMPTTKYHIPVDSTWELAMADALRRAGRAYLKPLRYDGSEDYFPDFVLTDKPPQRIVIEVLGMLDNPDYRAHAAEKRRRYEQTGVRLLEWDVSKPMPALDLDSI
ncbi:DUF1173 family protein [Nocardia niigatensis]